MRGLKFIIVALQKGEFVTQPWATLSLADGVQMDTTACYPFLPSDSAERNPTLGKTE